MLSCQIADNAYPVLLGIPGVDRLSVSARGWGAAEEFTTLASRHTAEDAVVEPPTSQREVETSHPDRVSRANRFRQCRLLRAPDPRHRKEQLGSSRRQAALPRQPIASGIRHHPFDRRVAALGWVAHRRPSSRSGRPRCPGSAPQTRPPPGEGRTPAPASRGCRTAEGPCAQSPRYRCSSQASPRSWWPLRSQNPCSSSRASYCPGGNRSSRHRAPHPARPRVVPTA
jgi:hypothetical protein